MSGIRKTVVLLLCFDLLFVPSTTFSETRPSENSSSSSRSGGGKDSRLNRQSCNPNASISGSVRSSSQGASTRSGDQGTPNAQRTQNQGQTGQQNNCLEWVRPFSTEAAQQTPQGQGLLEYVKHLLPASQSIDSFAILVRQTRIGKNDPDYPFFYFTSVTVLNGSTIIGVFSVDTIIRSEKEAQITSVSGELFLESGGQVVAATEVGEILSRSTEALAAILDSPGVVSSLIKPISTFTPQVLFIGNACVCNNLIGTVNVAASNLKTRRERFWIAYATCIGAILVGGLSGVGTVGAIGIGAGCILGIGAQMVSLLAAERQYEMQKYELIACLDCCVGEACTTEICERYTPAGVSYLTHFCPKDRCPGQNPLPIGSSTYNKAIGDCDRRMDGYSGF